MTRPLHPEQIKALLKYLDSLPLANRLVWGTDKEQAYLLAGISELRRATR